MGDATWPTGIRHVLISGKNTQQFTASGAIKAGQVVAFNSTGVSMTVQAAVTSTTETIVGVAIYDAADGAQVTVAMRGCIAYVVNGLDNDAIDAGDPVGPITTGLVGSVCPIPASGVLCTPIANQIVGFAVEDVTGAAVGQQFACIISPGYYTPAS